MTDKEALVAMLDNIHEEYRETANSITFEIDEGTSSILEVTFHFNPTTGKLTHIDR